MCGALDAPPDRVMNQRKLLIVEAPGHDSPHVRQLAMRTGFKVVACNCSHMVSKAVSSLEPDLVLIAPQPSVERTSEIARTIKENPATSDIPVLLLTDSAQPEDFLSRAYPTEACLPATCTDDEWRSTVRLLMPHMSHRPQGRPPAALEGNLEEDVFPELFQYLCLTGKSGRMRIRSGGSRGRIDLDNGNIVHVELDDRSGVEAFEQICFLSRGRFEFEANRSTPWTTMREKGIDLLFQAIYKKDEMTKRRFYPGTPRETRKFLPTGVDRVTSRFG